MKASVSITGHSAFATFRLHGPNNIAKNSLIPDSVIGKAQLRPKRGPRRKPRLGPSPRQGSIVDLSKEEAP